MDQLAMQWWMIAFRCRKAWLKTQRYGPTKTLHERLGVMQGAYYYAAVMALREWNEDETFAVRLRKDAAIWSGWHETCLRACAKQAERL